MIRRHAIINPGRVVTQDIVYKGVHLKKGDMVLCAVSSANIDEKHYPDAWHVDFARADKKNLTFGRGPHVCIGSYVARTELRVFVEEWLKRIPNFQIKEGEKIKMDVGYANRILKLPLTWRVR